METLSQCPLCSSTDVPSIMAVIDHYLTKKEFSITRCGTCGFSFTNPRPTKSELGAFYDSDNYLSHTNSDKGLVPLMYYWARRFALGQKFRTISDLSSGRKLLDYGCGSGAFLGHMQKHGYAVCGVEPSSAARSAAEAQGLLEIHESLSTVQSTTFNIVTLWHVLEHLEELHATIQHLKPHLTKGGLMLIAVPDITSWDAQHYGPNWAALDVPRHLSHFRPVDMHRLAASYGLVVQSTRRMWFDAPYICILSEKYQGRGVLPSVLIGMAKGLFSNLVALLQKRSTSSTLYILKVH